MIVDHCIKILRIMKRLLNHSQFSESFLEMTAQLDFDIQNYVTSLLAPNNDTFLSFDYTKSEEEPTSVESEYWDKLEAIAF